MGYDYYTGEGVEKDPEKALACFTKAAGLGHSRAQFNLGLCYMNGAGVEQSDKEAAIWFERAVRQDIKEALYPLGICHYSLENYTEAYAWALYAESQGDTRLREMLDPMYSEEEIDAGKTRFRELKKTLEQSKI
jgi:TPR repeat protein